MGTGYGCRCKMCGYGIHANLGVGFMFPNAYREHVDRMKSGGYGPGPKKFFEEHPDGAIDCETVVAKCLSCGDCGPVPDLTMYVPKEGYNPAEAGPKQIWSVAFPFEGAEYVTKTELEESYVPYGKFDHRCPECGGAAEIIKDFEKQLQEGILKCPKCNGDMEIEDVIMWD